MRLQGWFWALVLTLGCDPDSALLLPGRENAPVDLAGLTLVARVVHVTDTHLVDEESPARFAGAHAFTSTAWRPYESYSTQLFDGIIRTVNRIHAAGRTIDFVVHTGDCCDNAQFNELDWLLAVLEGEVVNPLSGPDDRPAGTRPPPAMDPHALFQAQGLYRTHRHGDLPSIPWYVLIGNHDVYSMGVFPIVQWPDGHRTAPLPLDFRPGVVLPVNLDPVGCWAHGNVTPADPGPPRFLEFPSYVEPNPDRAFFNKREFIRAMFDTASGPIGHGFTERESGPTRYSVCPVPGLRLIGLDTCDAAISIPGFFYPDGAISAAQVDFLRSELDAALDSGEIVIVATHHPSARLKAAYGSALVGSGFRALLNSYPNVVLHLTGHLHRNRVTDHGGYIEIETCSTLDLPQEGRIIEIWRDDTDGTVIVSYEMFSHIDDTLPALEEDPLRAMRGAARAIALGDKDAATRQKRFDPTGEDPRGRPTDRKGQKKGRSRL